MNFLHLGERCEEFMYLLMMYDVPAKRTGKYHKLLGKYLNHLQYSVFGGDITEADAIKLRKEVEKILQPGDHISEVATANRQNIVVTHWTRQPNQPGPPIRKNDSRHKDNFLVL